MTVGRALSDLALRGYEAEEQAAQPPDSHGFPMLPPVSGHVITDEMVERALTEDD